jgi:predicted peroxiredoxin
MGKVLVHLTHAKDDVERASLAFVVANAGLSADQDVTVLLTVEGVRCAVQGYTEPLQADGHAPLAELMQKFIDNDGALWVCRTCAKPRGITAEQLIPGAQMVEAAAAIEALVNGAQTLSW